MRCTLKVLFGKVAADARAHIFTTLMSNTFKHTSDRSSRSGRIRKFSSILLCVTWRSWPCMQRAPEKKDGNKIRKKTMTDDVWQMPYARYRAWPTTRKLVVAKIEGVPRNGVMEAATIQLASLEVLANSIGRCLKCFLNLPTLRGVTIGNLYRPTKMHGGIVSLKATTIFFTLDAN